jgi:hypothetical protein
MGIGYLLLILFGAYAFLKFHAANKTNATEAANRSVAAPGVPYYCNLAVSNRPQQVLAAQKVNGDMATVVGYAPAFGPQENMPSDGTEVWF